MSLQSTPNVSDIKYLKDDYTLCWDKIDCLLPETESTKRNLDSRENCLILNKLIDSLIQETGSIMSKSNLFNDILNKYSQWTCSTREVLEILNETANQNKLLISLLRLTSLLEFSLGNVYQSLTHRQPPHLLKDLLQELSQFDVFQQNKIFLLQIVLGSSKGLNLRNIAWHGFIDTIDVRYVSFLLVIIVSYGKLFDNGTIHLRHRPEISLSIPFIDETSNFDVIVNSPTVSQLSLVSWKTILSLYNCNNAKSAIFLLLAQTESLLRFIYGQLNEIDVSARPDKYYVILDSIFYEYVLDDNFTPLVIGKINKAQELEIRKKNKRNRMLEVFPSSLMYLGFDVFHAADGPRVRDKISHGEAVCELNSDVVSRTILQFILNIIKYYEHKTPPSFDYESVYMNCFKAARIFNKLVLQVEKTFREIEIPNDLKIVESLKFDIELNEIDVKKVKGFFRPFCETEILKLLLNILENVDKALTNFSLSCNEFFDMFKARKLSSTRRETLKQMILDLPNLFKGFQGILRLVRIVFSEIQQVDDERNFDLPLKILKTFLKFTESLIKHFFHGSRNFHLANEKTCEFLLLLSDKKCNYLYNTKIQ